MGEGKPEYRILRLTSTALLGISSKVSAALHLAHSQSILTSQLDYGGRGITWDANWRRITQVIGCVVDRRSLTQLVAMPISRCQSA